MNYTPVLLIKYSLRESSWSKCLVTKILTSSFQFGFCDEHLDFEKLRNLICKEPSYRKSAYFSFLKQMIGKENRFFAFFGFKNLYIR